MSAATAVLYEHAEMLGAPLPPAVVAHLDAEARVHEVIALDAKLDATFGPQTRAEYEWALAVPR